MTEELSPGVLAELHKQLEARREQLKTEIDNLQNTEGTAGGRADDPTIDVIGDSGEASTTVDTWAFAHQEEIDLRDQLAEVEHALSKFAAGTYGRCEQCGQPIPVARLRAFPETRYDVAHQAEREARVRGTL